MLNWLTELPVDPEQLTVRLLAARLLAALIGGLCVAGFYRLSHGRDRNATSGLVTTLVLLAVLIALVSVVIGSSVARAFSLVGALSIVRFRTAVEDTSDTAFVIFSVTLGMGLGAGFLMLAYLAFPLLTVATIVMAFVTREKAAKRKGTLKVRLPLGIDANALLRPVLNRFDAKATLIELETGNKGASMDYAFQMSFDQADDAVKLLAEIHKLEGVQSAEVKLQKS
jgi:uncharacterized membrane protein YhiD involved in acid resistance